MAGKRPSMNCRLAGILVPVFSLRGENDLGIGDVRTLHDFVNFAAETGFGFVQLLPVNETGPDNSPYNAISSVAIEPMTLDCSPDGLKDLSKETFAEVLSVHDPEALREGAVQYAEVRRLKHDLLRRAYERFCETVLHKVDTRAASFEAFCRDESGWLNDYCLFRFLMDREGGSQVWQLWPTHCQSREHALDVIVEEAKIHPDEIDRELRYYAYVQWIAFTQWSEVADHARSKGVALMGDIPYGISLYSVDVWANPEIFDLDWYGGAPPEQLFKDDEFVQKWGQNWGIPLYRWDVLEARDFDWWRQRVAQTTRFFEMFRVDHALGFYRIYSFPWNPVRNAEFLPLSHEEAAGHCGGHLPGFRPRGDDTEESRAANRAEGEKYLRMVLEAAGDAEVIAEDLGTVPDYVRPSLAALGIAGMKVPQWEFSDGHITSGLHYPARSFATYASHDHAPMRTQWEQQHEQMSGHGEESHEHWEARNFLHGLCSFAGIERPDGITPEYSPEIWEKLMRGLCLSHSDRVAFLINDLLHDTRRINIPGVMGGLNWSYRLEMTAKELTSGKEFGELRANLKNVLNETGRSRRVRPRSS